MSLGPFSNSSALEPTSLVPWQYRVRPALFVTVSAVVAVLTVVGSLVVFRRFTGAIAADLPPHLMLMLAFASAITLWVLRLAWRRSFPLESPADLSTADQVIGWGSSAALALLAVGCCYPANRTTDWLIWLPILVADQLWRQTFFDAGEPWTPETADEFPVATTLTIADTPENENIVQQLYRLEEPPGTEVIYGTLRADFVAGQRTAVVHAGFCPPLGYIPEIDAEALPGSLAQIKVVQGLAHGARLDVRLPAPAVADCQVWIDMAARPVGSFAKAKTA